MRKHFSRRPLLILIGLMAVAPTRHLLAQERDSLAEAGGVAPTEATADTAPPPIGLVEFFGLHQLAEDSLRAMLGLPPAAADLSAAPVVDRSTLPLLAARLAVIPEVDEARFETVCCHEGRTILFVGVRESGIAEPAGHRTAPTGEGRLPNEIMQEYAGFLAALTEAVRAGRTDDDISQGHSLVADSAARSYQLRFPALANTHLDLLREVLRESGDAGYRAVAAAVIGYASDKGSAAADLVWALQDPDPAVRNNATRSLAAIVVYAKANPDLSIEIPVEPVVEMLHSLVWTDRNKALSLLTYLAGPGDETFLPVLRREAIPTLAEMARWRSPGHALPAFILLGRMAGLSDEETLRAWLEGGREEVIARAQGRPEG